MPTIRRRRRPRTILVLLAWLLSTPGITWAFEVFTLPNPIPVYRDVELTLCLESGDPDFDHVASDVLLNGISVSFRAASTNCLIASLPPLSEGTHALRVMNNGTLVDVPLVAIDFTPAREREVFLRNLVVLLDHLRLHGLIDDRAYRPVLDKILFAGDGLWNDLAGAVQNLREGIRKTERRFPGPLAGAFAADLALAIDLLLAPFPFDFVEDVEAEKEQLVQSFFQVQDRLAVQDGRIVYTGEKREAVDLAGDLRSLTDKLPGDKNRIETEVTIDSRTVTIRVVVGKSGRASKNKRDGEDVTASGGDVNVAVAGDGEPGTQRRQGGNGGNATAVGGSVAIAVGGAGGAGGAGADGGNGGHARAEAREGGEGFAEGGPGGTGGKATDPMYTTTGGDGGRGGNATVTQDGEAQGGPGAIGGEGLSTTPPRPKGGNGGNGGIGGNASVYGNGKTEGGTGGGGGAGGSHPRHGGNGGDGQRGGHAGSGSGQASGGTGGAGGAGGGATPPPGESARGGNGGGGANGGNGSVETDGESSASGGTGGAGGEGGHVEESESERSRGGNGGFPGNGGNASGPEGSELAPGAGGAPGPPGTSTPEGSEGSFTPDPGHPGEEIRF